MPKILGNMLGYLERLELAVLVITLLLQLKWLIEGVEEYDKEKDTYSALTIFF